MEIRSEKDRQAERWVDQTQKRKIKYQNTVGIVNYFDVLRSHRTYMHDKIQVNRIVCYVLVCQTYGVLNKYGEVGYKYIRPFWNYFFFKFTF